MTTSIAVVENRVASHHEQHFVLPFLGCPSFHLPQPRAPPSPASWAFDNQFRSRASNSSSNWGSLYLKTGRAPKGKAKVFQPSNLSGVSTRYSFQLERMACDELPPMALAARSLFGLRTLSLTVKLGQKVTRGFATQRNLYLDFFGGIPVWNLWNQIWFWCCWQNGRIAFPKCVYTIL